MIGWLTCNCLEKGIENKEGKRSRTCYASSFILLVVDHKGSLLDCYTCINKEDNETENK